MQTVDPREATEEELAVMPFNLPVRTPLKFGPYTTDLYDRSKAPKVTNLPIHGLGHTAN